MPETDIGSAVASDLTNVVKDFSVSSETTDGPQDQKETIWFDNRWDEYFGYYTDEKIPEITAIIDTAATWTVGKGFRADEATTMQLDTIKGNGFDTFNTILENADRVMSIGGNFYAQIILDEEGNLLNLRPLDPSVMKHHANREGVITHFSQMSKTKGKPDMKFEADQIFFLQRNRVADEIHGRGIIQKLKLIMDMKNEAMKDNKTTMHRYVVPRWIFKLDTDDTAEIATFKTKADKANADGENLYLPTGAVEIEPMAMAANATLNPMQWINYLDNLFYQVGKVPKIVVGGSSEFTEKASSIVYLAYQQNIEGRQLYMEEQVLSQLNKVIELEFPVSLENELLSDEKKDEEPTTVQPNETTAGAGQ
ncbi:MAG: phage portal protein [Patescibacteria group bacterium]|nr:phage portal protein [Patescibacteria group bacterium]MCP6727540.1 phage portal protein [Patescibacteria group bacterium]